MAGSVAEAIWPVNGMRLFPRAFRLLDAVRAEQRLSAWSRTSSPSAAAADFGESVPICAILGHALSERCPPVAQNVIPVCHGILWIVGESAARRGSTRAGSIYLLASACHEDRVARMYCPVQWPLRIIERPWLVARLGIRLGRPAWPAACGAHQTQGTFSRRRASWYVDADSRLRGNDGCAKGLPARE